MITYVVCHLLPKIFILLFHMAGHYDTRISSNDITVLSNIFPPKINVSKSIPEGALPPTLFPLVKSTVGHFPTKISTKQSLNGGEGVPPTLFPLVLKAHMLIFSTASRLYQHVYKQKLALCSQAY